MTNKQARIGRSRVLWRYSNLVSSSCTRLTFCLSLIAGLTSKFPRLRDIWFVEHDIDFLFRYIIPMQCGSVTALPGRDALNTRAAAFCCPALQAAYNNDIT